MTEIFFGRSSTASLRPSILRAAWKPSQTSTSTQKFTSPPKQIIEMFSLTLETEYVGDRSMSACSMLARRELRSWILPPSGINGANARTVSRGPSTFERNSSARSAAISSSGVRRWHRRPFAPALIIRRLMGGRRGASA